MSDVHPHGQRPLRSGEARWMRALNRVQVPPAAVERFRPPKRVQAAPLPPWAQARAQAQSQARSPKILVHYDREVCLEESRTVDPEAEEAAVQENGVRQHFICCALDILDGIEPS